MTEEQKMQERQRIGQRFAEVRKETEWVDENQHELNNGYKDEDDI